MRSGILAEFADADAIVRAYDRLDALGYTLLEWYAPYPVRGIVRRRSPSRISWVMLAGGLGGAAFGYLVQWWCNGFDFPINVGGRPLNSVPAFIPITFESAVLFASLTGFVSLLVAARLPRLYHRVFTVDGFDRASVDRFWVAIDESDPRFDASAVQDEMLRLGALRCERVREEAES
jgi:hypothetical protein